MLRSFDARCPIPTERGCPRFMSWLKEPKTFTLESQNVSISVILWCVFVRNFKRKNVDGLGTFSRMCCHLHHSRPGLEKAYLLFFTFMPNLWKPSSLTTKGLLMGYFHIQCIQISAAAAAAVHLNRYILNIYMKSHTCLFSLKNVSLLTFLYIFEEDNWICNRNDR